MAGGSERLLGRVAVAAKLITMDQLSEATRIQGREGAGQNIGKILVEQGMLTEQQLAKVIRLQKAVVSEAKRKRSNEPLPMGDGLPAAHGEKHVEVLASDRDVALPDDRPADLGAAIRSATEGGSLDALLRGAVQAGASDLHIHSGAPVKLRVHGELWDSGEPPLSCEIAERLIFQSFTDEDRAAFEAHGEQDYCYTIEGLGRFRTSAYRQLRGTDATFRFITATPPSLDDLGLPTSLARLTTFHQGMVLLTGPTSCGKSSTMAALVNLINEERTEHILTIEDPIEYLHESRRCLVNQRSVNRHTNSFARALRGALREDPDVIVIGELRDTETISLALTAAETGHLVLASLHTDNAIRTINRLAGAFPPDQQEQVRAMISESLKAVVSQRLIPTADEKGVVAALEVMIVNRAVGNLIRENKTVQIFSLLQTGASHGMYLLDDSLMKLVRRGIITREAALQHCDDPTRIPG